MFIIGELINGMFADIGRAIKEKDKAAVQQCALRQLQAGADALDINCGPASRDPLTDMPWLVEAVQEVTDKPLCLDSSKPRVIEAGLRAARAKALINSVTADEEKLAALVPLAKQYNAGLIGIAINSKGIPQSRDQRLELAAMIVSSCIGQGLPAENLYLDPIVLPVKVAQAQMRDILETIREFKLICDPAPKAIIGLSNVSQGAASRSLINRTFMAMAIAEGLDAAILDPLDKELMDTLITAGLILNKNIYCDSYLEAYRKK
jgi:5-methyltetrahydrofolate corrinoid/iron sulfur protein methyltransferase